MTLQTVVLTGTRRSGDASAASGTLNFSPSAVLTDLADDIGVDQAPIPVTLSQAGTFSVDLYATDNADLVAAQMPWCWNVTENIAGLPPYTWSFFLAFANGGTQDISSLTEITAPLGPDQQVWDATVAQGSAQSFNARFVIPWTSIPAAIDPAAWQYVVRETSDDGTGTPLVAITTTADSAGVLAVTNTAALAQVNIQMYAAATQALPPGDYSHALWEYPGQPDALAMFTGQLIITEAAQPVA